MDDKERREMDGLPFVRGETIKSRPLLESPAPEVLSPMRHHALRVSSPSHQTHRRGKQTYGNPLFPYTPADLQVSPNDRESLQSLIAAEKAVVTEAIAASLHGAQIRVSAAARFNCSDRLWAAQTCTGGSTTGWISGLFSSSSASKSSSNSPSSYSDCVREVEAFRACVTAQEGFLLALGFAQKAPSLTPKERWALVDAADDLYLASLKESSSSDPPKNNNRR
jgi:hypothetical protein